MSNFLRVGIVADDKTTKGINSAKKNLSGLDKTVNKLGKTFASVFAVQKVAAFGKASAQAYMADEKAASMLANTVKNLGLAFAAPSVENFIQNLQRTSGVLDDQLRPAMQKLLTTTGSINKSQELLNQAIEISRGSGVDLGTVVSDLSAAYVGNTKGLKKYALGLTQAELKTMSFAEIQKKFNQQFAGSSQAYLETYAGKLDLINAAASDAKETIGKGLLDALSTIAGEKTSIQGIADAFGNVATEISNVLMGIGKLDRAVLNLPGVGMLAKVIKWSYEHTSGLHALASFGAPKQGATGASTIGDYQMGATARANAAARKKAEADATKRAKELAKLQKQSLADKQKEAALKKAQGIFDLQQIELVAALQGKITEDERKRAEAQLAILTGNVELATKLTNEIVKAQDSTGNLAKFLSTLPNAKNPFEYLDAYIEELKSKWAAAFPTTVTPTQPIPGITNTPGMDLIDKMPATGGSIFDNYTPPSYSYGDWRKAESASMQPIVLQLDGKVVAASLANTSASGTSSFVDRNLGSFVV